MSKPILLVIAGCNGSGKSSFSKLLSPSGTVPFDYDFYYLQFYQSIRDSELRDTMAHNMAFEELKSQVKFAISNQKNFFYETNFNHTPLYWPQLFKENGYELRMIYLCLDSIDEAKRRVAIRVLNGGHFVSDEEIYKRYYEGFKHLNTHFNFFDCVDLFDTSAYKSEPRYILSIENSEVYHSGHLPDYLKNLISNITKHLEN